MTAERVSRPNAPFEGVARIHHVRAAWRLAGRSPIGAAALVVIVALAAVAILAPVITQFDPLELHRRDRLLGPNATYWLGTDSFGRDQFSRVVYGTRGSLVVGVAPVIVSTLVGATFGLFSGYAGGWVDIALQRVMDSIMAFPALLLALVIVSLLGPSQRNVIFVLTLVTIPTMDRIARAATITTVGLPFVESARSVGASHVRIIFQHVVPNIAAPVLVVSASLVGTAVLAEASLSFLGLGVPPPAPTWGNLLGGQNKDLFEVAPWLAIFPGLAITITVLAFNLLGDTVRDLLDPRTRERLTSTGPHLR